MIFYLKMLFQNSTCNKSTELRNGSYLPLNDLRYKLQFKQKQKKPSLIYDREDIHLHIRRINGVNYR